MAESLMPGFRYRTDVGKYYRSDKTQPVTQQQLRAVRNQLADGLMDEFDALARRYFSGEITLGGWGARFARLIRHGSTAGWLLGSGGANAVTRDALFRIDALIDAQTPFAEQFIRDLANVQMSPDQAIARSQLYAGTAVQAYEEAMAYSKGIDLPVYPGDGSTECLGRCRCSWTIETTDDEVSAWWDTLGDDRVCNGCLAMSQRYNPLVIAR